MNRIEKTSSKPKQPPKKHLIGLGLDNEDGHKRITQAEQFSIVGGSEETHSRMTETVVKTFETLNRKGKTLDEVESNELAEIIHKNKPD
ncbi:MAG: hypothetical protein AAF065_06215 [Verrucomicrobiota bacterium]